MEEEGTAGPTHGRSGEATRGRHIELRGGACLPLLAAGRGHGDLGAARHVRHGLRRAFIDKFSTLSAHDTRLRSHEAGPACGGGPALLRGRLVRGRARFGGGGGGGTACCARATARTRRPIPGKTSTRRNAGEPRECRAIAIDDVGEKVNTCFAVLIVKNHTRPPVALSDRPRPAAVCSRAPTRAVPVGRHPS